MDFYSYLERTNQILAESKSVEQFVERFNFNRKLADLFTESEDDRIAELGNETNRLIQSDIDLVTQLFNDLDGVKDKIGNPDPLLDYYVTYLVVTELAMIKSSVIRQFANDTEMRDRIVSDIDNRINKQTRRLKQGSTSFNVDILYGNLRSYLRNQFPTEIRHAIGMGHWKLFQNTNWNTMLPTEIGKQIEILDQELKDQQENSQRSLHQDEMYEDDHIAMAFNDGFAWWYLPRASCSVEASKMGHCGNSSGSYDDTIFSLREAIDEHGRHVNVPKKDMETWPRWVVRATFILNGDGYLGEMKGYGNNKPSKKYHPYIVPLIMSDLVKGIHGGGYLPQNNFSISDLPREQALKLMEIKPTIATLADKILIRGVDNIDPKELADELGLYYHPELGGMNLSYKWYYVGDEYKYDAIIDLINTYVEDSNYGPVNIDKMDLLIDRFRDSVFNYYYNGYDDESAFDDILDYGPFGDAVEDFILDTLRSNGVDEEEIEDGSLYELVNKYSDIDELEELRTNIRYAYEYAYGEEFYDSVVSELESFMEIQTYFKMVEHNGKYVFIIDPDKIEELVRAALAGMEYDDDYDDYEDAILNVIVSDITGAYDVSIGESLGTYDVYVYGDEIAKHFYFNGDFRDFYKNMTNIFPVSDDKERVNINVIYRDIHENRDKLGPLYLTTINGGYVVYTLKSSTEDINSDNLDNMIDILNKHGIRHFTVVGKIMIPKGKYGNEGDDMGTITRNYLKYHGFKIINGEIGERYGLTSNSIIRR